MISFGVAARLRRTPPPGRRRGAAGFEILTFAAIAIVFVGIFSSAAPIQLSEFGSWRRDFLQGVGLGDFAPRSENVAPMLETLGIALWSTMAGLIVAIPWGGAMSRLTSRPLRDISRIPAQILTSVPEILTGPLFILTGAPLQLAGIAAMGLGTAARLGLTVASTIDKQQNLELDATRLPPIVRILRLRGEFLPNSTPRTIALVAGQLQRNTASAVILGFFGLAGIGPRLFDALNSFDYARAASLLGITTLVLLGLHWLTQSLGRLAGP